MNALEIKERPFSTQVSNYDRVSAALAACVAVLSFFAILLALAVWGKRIYHESRTPHVIFFGEDENSLGAPAGTSRLEEPTENELVDIVQPDLSTALAAIVATVDETKGVGESFEGDGIGKGGEDDDKRKPGPPEPEPTIPMFERWEIRFQTKSKKEYAKQLDFFEVELGAIDKKSPAVHYAFKLSLPTPKNRAGTRLTEERLFFVHGRKSDLTELSRQLLSDAGIKTEDRYLAQFYPAVTQKTLESVERTHMGDRSISKVAKTVFGIRPHKMGYEFYVIKQDYLP